jgi:signal transduction histidine kinase
MRVRDWVSVIALVAFGALLAGWAAVEARQQRREVERVLAAEAEALAAALAPALATASSAVRELEELSYGKLLDNARWLARLWSRDEPPPRAGLDELALAHGLDSVLWVEAPRHVVAQVGRPVPPRLVGELDPLLSEAADELVLAPAPEDPVPHAAVGVSAGPGRAVLVRAHLVATSTVTSRVGVENLLRSLVASGGVAYLAYEESPGPVSVAAAWDGGPLPEPAAGRALRAIRGRQVFEVRVPVEVPAGLAASLRVGLSGDPLTRASLAATRRTLLIGLVLIAAAIALGAYATVRHARARERAESGRRLLAAERARQQSERLAAAGALTAGLAHEVRSPLNAIGLAAQRLERRLPEDDPSGRPLAATIRREVRRLESVLSSFLTLAGAGSTRRDDIDLVDLAERVRELLAAEAAERPVVLEAVSGRGHARVDPDAVQGALVNLVRNAIQHSPAHGTVRMVVETGPRAAVLRVIDEGPGIAPEDAERAFEPFYTTRADGSGLGLSLVRRVAEEHGGECSLLGRPAGGTVAELVLAREACS